MNYISDVARFGIARCGESVVLLQDDGSDFFYGIEAIPMSDAGFWNGATRLVQEVIATYPMATFTFTPPANTH